jgi:hypothetical protein
VVAALAAEVPGVLAQVVEDRIYALLPGPPEDAAARSRGSAASAAVGVSSHRTGAAEARRALDEAELVLRVTEAGGGPPGEEIGEGTYRLLFRVWRATPRRSEASTRTRWPRWCATTSSTRPDLLGTLAAYLDANCNTRRRSRSTPTGTRWATAWTACASSPDWIRSGARTGSAGASG